jgi:hypothetical protein
VVLVDVGRVGVIVVVLVVVVICVIAAIVMLIVVGTVVPVNVIVIFDRGQERADGERLLLAPFRHGSPPFLGTSIRARGRS